MLVPSRPIIVRGVVEWSRPAVTTRRRTRIWLLSTVGAYSINCADTAPGSGVLDPDTLMVRARRREHLELLQGQCEAIAESPILETPRGDYAFRVVAPKAVVARVVGELVLSVDYPNFKSACAQREAELGPGYGAALHSIWSVLARLQE